MQRIKCRWNTEFYMVERCLVIQKSLTMTLMKFDEDVMPELKKDDWKLAVDFTHVTSPLEATCKTLCGDEYANVSLVIPSVWQAKQICLDK